MAKKAYPSPDKAPTKKVKSIGEDPVWYLPFRTTLKRLPGFDYSNPQSQIFLTFRIKRPLNDPFLFCEVLQGSILRFHFLVGFGLYAYTCMPDHAHMIVSPSGKGETVSRIVQRIRDSTTKRLKHQFGVEISWARGFHDHVLRPDERSEEIFSRIVHYIMENPVRKNLAAKARDWPYSGIRNRVTL
ncbi:MAG: transposase [Planctomycetota bacterium]|jgi:REP element-mobilizing transposase RayT